MTLATWLTVKENQNIVEPPCAFEECLYPLACHGAANPDKYVDDRGADPGAVALALNMTEECDQENGYSNWCDSTSLDDQTNENGTVTRTRVCLLSTESKRKFPVVKKS